MRIISKTLIVLLFMTSCSVIAQNSRTVSIKSYKENIQQVIRSLIDGEKLTKEQISNAVPKTEEGYFEFMSYTDKGEESKTAFFELNNLILESAMNKEKDIFKSFLLLSEFVDGYFAESYFDDAEAVIEKNPDLFCEIYRQLPKEKVKRLVSFYEQRCK